MKPAKKTNQVYTGSSIFNKIARDFLIKEPHVLFSKISIIIVYLQGQENQTEKKIIS